MHHWFLSYPGICWEQQENWPIQVRRWWSTGDEVHGELKTFSKLAFYPQYAVWVSTWITNKKKCLIKPYKKIHKVALCLSVHNLSHVSWSVLYLGRCFLKPSFFPFTGQMRDLSKYQREICQSHEKFSIALTLFLLYFTQDVRKITNYCMTPESYLMSFICCFWEIWHYYMKCATLSFWFMFMVNIIVYSFARSSFLYFTKVNNLKICLFVFC